MSYGSLLTIAKAYLDTIQVTNGSRICIVLDNDTSFDYLSKFYLNLNWNECEIAIYLYMLQQGQSPHTCYGRSLNHSGTKSNGILEYQ